MKLDHDELVKTGSVRLPFDQTASRRWYAPLALTLFGLFFVGVRYAYVSSDAWSTSVLVLYVVGCFGVLGFLGTAVAPYGQPAPWWLATLKIFGLPLLFLGFLGLLACLP